MTAPAAGRVSTWRVASASFAGTTVEYYDFAIYGTAAALVFPQLFFPTADPFVGTLAAYVGVMLVISLVCLAVLTGGPRVATTPVAPAVGSDA